ncbi:hypothetical protein ACFC3F_06600 [Microbacterium sp. NPDC055910]|uniref:hypothetical protein n=1 Tax=Microbacterium sp. NPDC055910 TaxID=3345659 RepID=UPI0035D66751
MSVASGVGAVALIVGLSACSAASRSATAESAKPSSLATQTATPTPTPTPPTLDLVTFSLECRYEDPSLYDWKKVGSSPSDAIVRLSFASFRDAWAAAKPFDSCEATPSGGQDYGAEQVAAAKAAGYSDLSHLKYLYALCGATSGFYVTNGPVSDAQQAEIAGMLVICPDFPGADALRAASAQATQAEQERAAGTRFWGAGVYVVGQDVQPGTYQASGSIKNCYWARLDSAGNTIDNNFIPAATQVQLTVATSDYSLDIQGGCGEWVRIG